jgi:allophanate hydrolase
MSLRHFGAFLAAIPAPLGIGNLINGDARAVKGFIFELAAFAPESGARHRFFRWLTRVSAEAGRFI